MDKRGVTLTINEYEAMQETIRLNNLRNGVANPHNLTPPTKPNGDNNTDADREGSVNPYNPDSNVTMPVGDMSIWDDDFVADDRTYWVSKAQAGDVAVARLTTQLSHMKTDAAIAQVAAFAIGVMLGYGISYVW